tara:strand:+ start:14086 stop:14289 length:204 start_codon:yes stop_codon:yes gene_type:complete
MKLGIPEVRVVGERYCDGQVSLDLEMDDEAHEKLVEIGMDEASEDDFFEIGFKKVLQDYLEGLEKES